jgi:hypothetical protein
MLLVGRPYTPGVVLEQISMRNILRREQYLALHYKFSQAGKLGLQRLDLGCVGGPFQLKPLVLIFDLEDFGAELDLWLKIITFRLLRE